MSDPTTDGCVAGTAIDGAYDLPAIYNHGAAFPAELSGWQRRLREQFPAICANPALTYMDNAAAAQKPHAVLATIQAYLATNTSAGGAHQSTALVERTRDRVRRFLGDPDPQRSSVHFVGGATEGLRAVAQNWLTRYLADGDELIVPFADHEANAQPWLEAQEQLARNGIRVTIREMPYGEAGEYDDRALAGLVNKRTRFVAATHVHHLYGGNMNVHRIRRVVGPDVLICLDAAQGVGHLPVSMAELDVDFVVFSGQKVMALPGTGAVWARNARGPEFRPGGWAGIPDISEIVSLEAALDWLDAAGLDMIARWIVALGARLTNGLRHLGDYHIPGCPVNLAADSPVQQRHGIVTFGHRGISANDLRLILADHGFIVKAISPPQTREVKWKDTVRVSMHVYNTPEEVDRLLSVLASHNDTQRSGVMAVRRRGGGR